MLWLFSQIYVLCAVSFGVGSLVTWLLVSGRARVEPQKPVLALPAPRTPVEKLTVEEQPVAPPVPKKSLVLKGNSKTMVCHAPESPYYKRMKGDVAFSSEADAVAAGYRMWTARARVKV